MSVCYGVIVRIRINQRCVCVSSGVLMSFAPCNPGPRVLSPLCRSTSCAGISDGAVPLGCAGRNHYIAWISWGQGFALLDHSGLPCARSHGGLSAVLCLSLGCDCSVDIIMED